MSKTTKSEFKTGDRVRAIDGLVGSYQRFSKGQHVIRCDGDGKERAQKEEPVRIDTHAPLDLGSAEDRKNFLEAAFEADDGNISVGGLYVEMAKSLTLNDFVEQPDFPDRFKESFKPGETEIWYRLNGKLRDDPKQGLSFLTPKPPKISELEKTHVKIGSVAETHLETLFSMLQDWIPTPPGSPGRMFLAARGAEHTSMSVGDVVKIGDKAWMCASSGWITLEV